MNFDFLVSVCNSNLFRVASLLECLRGCRCSISFHEGFSFTFFRLYPWWIVKSLGEISFSFRGFFPFFLFIFALWTSSWPLFLLFFLSTCRMTRGHEEVSTNQVGRRRGIPRETPTTNSLIVAMSVEELRLYI